jgi:hypothetical protein
MVVRTRSYYAKNTNSASGASGTVAASRSKMLHTHSLREASIRSYKIYTPKRKVRISEYEDTLGEEHHDDHQPENIDVLMSDAADIMVSFQNHDADVPHCCINPMSPIQKYIYRIDVYNAEQTIHYKTAYVIYDPNTRKYTVHVIVSNVYTDEIDGSSVSGGGGGSVSNSAAYSSTRGPKLPPPKDTIQMKYSTYGRESTLNYIFAIVIPSVEYDYYIKDDIIGIVGIDNSTLYNEDACFYDIERIVHDSTSNETTNGYKAFMLIPSRNFWYIPSTAAAYTATTTLMKAAASAILEIL